MPKPIESMEAFSSARIPGIFEKFESMDNATQVVKEGVDFIYEGVTGESPEEAVDRLLRDFSNERETPHQGPEKGEEVEVKETEPEDK